MQTVFQLPQMSMTMVDGVVTAWHKNVGDFVKANEPLLEVETDKMAKDLTSPVDGYLVSIAAAVDDLVPVGGELCRLADQMDESSEPAVQKSEEPAEPEKAAATAPAAYRPSDAKQRISPLARRIAAMEGLSTEGIAGSGPGGRIIERDVRAFLAAGKPGAAGFGAASGFAAGGVIQEDRLVPLTGIRKVIASRMHQSLQEAAQANHRMDVEMSSMKALRAQLNLDPRFKERKISFMDLMTACCARAIADCPYVNVSLEQEGIREKSRVNIGIAVDTPRGLVVPVLKDAAGLDIAGISAGSAALIEKARDGKLMPDDMTGGTFTISNLGMFGIDSFTAILNPPESCILAVGRIADRVVPVDGAPAVRPMMTLSLTYDHRIIDGAPAARFLQRIGFYMENPALVLLPRG